MELVIFSTLAQIILNWPVGFVRGQIFKVMAHRPDLILRCGLCAWPILLIVDPLVREELERLKWRPLGLYLCVQPSLPLSSIFAWLLGQLKITSQFLGKICRPHSLQIFFFVSSIPFYSFCLFVFFLISLMKDQVFP